jgi:hypothetical protein
MDAHLKLEWHSLINLNFFNKKFVNKIIKKKFLYKWKLNLEV